MNLRAVCHKCNNKLVGNFGRIEIVYKHCPRCGTDNRPSMRTETHGLIYRWSLELLYFTWALLVTAFMGRTVFFIVCFMAILACMLTRLLYKPCSCCLTITCKRSHQFCHNCGKEFN